MGNPDTTLFDQAYDALYHKVTGFVIQKSRDLSSVQDVVQDTFIELYSVLKKKGAAYIKNIEALVMKIAKTKLYRHYNSYKKLEVPLYITDECGEEYERAELTDFNIEDKYLNNQTLREVWAVIMTKPLDTQKVFALHYYCDYTLGEIAKMLDMSESAVKRRLYNTLTEIRNIYKQEGDKK